MASRIFFTLGIQGTDEAIRKVTLLEGELKNLAKQITDTRKIAKASGDYTAFDELTKKAVKTKQAMSDARKELRDSVKDARSATFPVDSLIGLQNQYAKLRKEIEQYSAAERASEQGRRKIELARSTSQRIRSIDQSIGSFKSNIGNYQDGFRQLADQASGGFLGGIGAGGSAAVVAGGLAIGVGIKELFELNKKFSDLKADIAKTTNLTAAETNEVIENLKALDTRTSLENLAQIAVIGGQLGVKGVKGVSAFTIALSDLDVALGDEFKGGVEEVATEVGKLSTVLFGFTEDGVVLADRISGIGNALNGLAASGNATSPIIADFSQRIGGVVTPLGVTAGQVLGLSAALEELAINPERGATAVNRSLLRMGADIGKFAKVLGLNEKALKESFDTNPLDAFIAVIDKATKLSGGSESTLLTILDDLGIRGANVAELFFKISKNQDLVNQRIGEGTNLLKDNATTVAELEKRQNSLAGTFERLKNKIRELAVQPDIERFFAFFIGGIDKIITGLGVGIGLISVFFGNIKDSFNGVQFDGIQRFRDAINQAQGRNEDGTGKVQNKVKSTGILSPEDSDAAKLDLSLQARRNALIKDAEARYAIEDGVNKFAASLDKEKQARRKKEIDDINAQFGIKKKLTKEQIESQLKLIEDGENREGFLSEKATKKRIAKENLEAEAKIKEEQEARDKATAARNKGDVEERVAALKAKTNPDIFKAEEDALKAKALKDKNRAEEVRLGVTKELMDEETKLIEAELERQLKLVEEKRKEALFVAARQLEELKAKNDISLKEATSNKAGSDLDALGSFRDERLQEVETNKDAAELDAADRRVKGLISKKQYEEELIKIEKDSAAKSVKIQTEYNNDLQSLARNFEATQKATLRAQSEENVNRIRREAAEARVKARKQSESGQLGDLAGAIGAIDAQETNALAKEAVELAAKELALREQIAGVQAGAAQAQVEAQKGVNANLEEDKQKRKESQQEILQEALSTASVLADSLFQIDAQRIENEKQSRTAALEEEYEDRLELASGNATLEKALKKELADKKLEIDKAAFEQQKKLQISQALTTAALASIAVFAVPDFTFGVATALRLAAIGVTLATSIATIKKQKFAKGGFTGMGFGQADETGQVPVGVVHENEYVATTRQLRKYPSLFNFLENDRKKFADGGLTSSFSAGNGSNALKVELSSEQIAALSDSIYTASKEGTTQGSKQGIYYGATEATRQKEREEALVTNNSF